VKLIKLNVLLVLLVIAAIATPSLVIAEQSAKSPVSKKLYRFVDSNGRVYYSDHPRKGAQEIEIEKVPSIQIKKNTINLEELAEQNEVKRDPNANYYDSITLTSIEKDGVVRNNGGFVVLTAALAPELSKGHFLKFYIDGKLLGSQQKALTLKAEDIEYGPHTASFSVVNQDGSKVQDSDTVHFNLLHIVRKKVGANRSKANNIMRTSLPEHPQVPTYESMKQTDK
jgi:uncharacterized protein DUF4124